MFRSHGQQRVPTPTQSRLLAATGVEVTPPTSRTSAVRSSSRVVGMRLPTTRTAAVSPTARPATIVSGWCRSSSALVGTEVLKPFLGAFSLNEQPCYAAGMDLLSVDR